MGLENYCRPPHRISKKVARRNHQEVFQTFALLKNVSTLEIDGGDKHTYQIPEINDLFPKARRTSLRGKMHYKLASIILHGEGKAHLVKLLLDNLQEGGIYRTGENYGSTSDRDSSGFNWTRDNALEF
jgi:hypothetical protein